MARKRLVDGGENVARVFAALKAKAREEIAHALNLSADEMVRDAKVLVPKDQRDLERTIRRTDLRVRADGRAVVVFVTAGDTRETANAAFRQEFGRDPGGSGKVDMSAHPGHRPQEFMFPAYWRNRRRARRRIAAAINKAVREAAARGR